VWTRRTKSENPDTSPLFFIYLHGALVEPRDRIVLVRSASVEEAKGGGGRRITPLILTALDQLQYGLRLLTLLRYQKGFRGSVLGNRECLQLEWHRRFGIYYRVE
jgi:hypothetical protein